MSLFSRPSSRASSSLVSPFALQHQPDTSRTRIESQHTQVDLVQDVRRRTELSAGCFEVYTSLNSGTNPHKRLKDFNDQRNYRPCFFASRSCYVCVFLLGLCATHHRHWTFPHPLSCDRHFFLQLVLCTLSPYFDTPTMLLALFHIYLRYARIHCKVLSLLFPFNRALCFKVCWCK